MISKKQLGQFTIFIFAIVSLVACGGGDSNDNFSGSTRSDISGDWLTDCIQFTDGTSEFRSASFLKNDNGDDVFFSGITEFSSDDCSSDSDTLVIGGPVSYRGGYSTSTCNAEKFDVVGVFASDGVTSVVGDAFQEFLDDSGIPERSFDIACKRGQQLLLGDDTGSLDGTTSGQRPTSMRVGIPYNVWNRSERSASKNSVSLTDHAEQINSSLRSLNNNY